MKDVKLKTGDLQGFNYILINLIHNKGLGVQLGGRNPEQRALVQQWLQYNLSHLTDKAAVSDYVLRVND